jgi:predicted Zn-dependent peptidase
MKSTQSLRPRHCAWIVFALLTASFCSAQKNPKDSFTFPPLNDIVTPKVQQTDLPNGMQIFLLEDHEFPTLTFRAVIKVGSVYEPPEKLGLATLTGAVLHIGGTENITGEGIDDMLELLGGTIQTGIGAEWGEVSISVFKQDLEAGLKLLADILMHPAFRTEKVELAKAWERSKIARRNDEPRAILAREFQKLIYGSTSPYARYPEYSTIDAVTRDDIMAFYGAYFHPNNTILSVWGDFDTEAMSENIKKLFQNWKRKDVVSPAVPEVKYDYKHTVNFIPKADLDQSHILIGHIGGIMKDPDYPALLVMNHILTSDRMFNTIRTREGLTYAPWGLFGAEYGHPGVFSCGTQTKSHSTVYAIRLIMAEVERMTNEEVTEEELERAKESYVNSFVFNFDSKEKIAGRLMTYAFYDYPLDFAEQTKRRIEQVTKADVHSVAKKYLKPDKMKILVVGNQADFDEPLSRFGDVNTIQIMIPPREN